MNNSTENEKKADLKKLIILFVEFMKVGLFTIGGGMAMLPVVQRYVIKHGWMTEEEFVDAVALSNAVPGAIAVSLSSLIGKKQAGTAGAILATIGVILPSFLIIVIIAMVLDSIGDNKYVDGALKGIKAAVCGMIIVSCIRLGKNILKNWWCWALAIATFILVAFVKVVAIWMILAGAVIGILIVYAERRKRND